jgi:hypothetical protein
MEILHFDSRRKFLLAPLLVGLSATVCAASLVSPPLYSHGGPSGGNVVCRIFQYGAASGEPIGTTAIYSNASTAPLVLNANSCNPSTGLQRNANCSYSAQIAGNLSYTCVFSASGAAGGRYTGTIEIQDSANNVLEHEAMLPAN